MNEILTARRFEKISLATKLFTLILSTFVNRPWCSLSPPWQELPFILTTSLMAQPQSLQVCFLILLFTPEVSTIRIDANTPHSTQILIAVAGTKSSVSGSSATQKTVSIPPTGNDETIPPITFHHQRYSPAYLAEPLTCSHRYAPLPAVLPPECAHSPDIQPH